MAWVCRVWGHSSTFVLKRAYPVCNEEVRDDAGCGAVSEALTVLSIAMPECTHRCWEPLRISVGSVHNTTLIVGFGNDEMDLVGHRKDE